MFPVSCHNNQVLQSFFGILLQGMKHGVRCANWQTKHIKVKPFNILWTIKYTLIEIGFKCMTLLELIELSYKMNRCKLTPSTWQRCPCTQHSLPTWLFVSWRPWCWPRRYASFRGSSPILAGRQGMQLVWLPSACQRGSPGVFIKAR